MGNKENLMQEREGLKARLVKLKKRLAEDSDELEQVKLRIEQIERDLAK